jgi:hypothetical protein
MPRDIPINAAIIVTCNGQSRPTRGNKNVPASEKFVSFSPYAWVMTNPLRTKKKSTKSEEWTTKADGGTQGV